MPTRTRSTASTCGERRARRADGGAPEVLFVGRRAGRGRRRRGRARGRGLAAGRRQRRPPAAGTTVRWRPLGAGLGLAPAGHPRRDRGLASRGAAQRGLRRARRRAHGRGRRRAHALRGHAQRGRIALPLPHGHRGAAAGAAARSTTTTRSCGASSTRTWPHRRTRRRPTSAWPPIPDAVYVLASFASEPPEVRGWTIVDGAVNEVVLERT